MIMKFDDFVFERQRPSAEARNKEVSICDGMQPNGLRYYLFLERLLLGLVYTSRHRRI